MKNLHECTLEIGFEFGSCNGKFINVTVETEHNKQSLIPIANKSVFQSVISLPAKINIVVDGKNNNEDTKVDELGNIVEDMYVQIKRISLDGFDLNDIYLYQKILLLTENGDTVTTNYFGFNGTATINFNEDNVFHQVLLCNT
jgi:hypothetical protein